MSRSSRLDYKATPSAIVSGVPLWAVTSMKLSEAYKLPPIGSSTLRAIIETHDDTVDLSGLLLGPERYTWKVALERAAEFSKRGGVLGRLTGGRLQGATLVTALTIRTSMQIQTLTFSVNADRRDVIEVAISLVHMPQPGGFERLADLASVAGVAVLADWRVGF